MVKNILKVFFGLIRWATSIRAEIQPIRPGDMLTDRSAASICIPGHVCVRQQQRLYHVSTKHVVIVELI